MVTGPRGTRLPSDAGAGDDSRREVPRAAAPSVTTAKPATLQSPMSRTPSPCRAPRSASGTKLNIALAGREKPQASSSDAAERRGRPGLPSLV